MQRDRYGLEGHCLLRRGPEYLIHGGLYRCPVHWWRSVDDAYAVPGR